MPLHHGFELIREQAVPELGSLARLYRHARTGAELLSLINDDENKVFGATFRTPPPDSTGIAHILEHSVLCGSRKYPVKDPFTELAKGSLNTFLNAITSADRTAYPVASQNLKDFYNLVDVYLDAVFHPRLTPQVVAQEGWHYELESIDAPLAFKGVVFNEMKGAYSSPDRLLAVLSQCSLFPDTPYGCESGGNPRRIPDLSYAQLKAFHARCYHPSNARLFFHGDDDPDERLRLLGAYLAEFSPAPVVPVPLQPRFTAPRRAEQSFPASGATRGMATVNFMLDEIDDAQTHLALTILEEVLVGTPASPLHKALIDSGLGDDVAGSGLVPTLRQAMFSIGLKNIDPAAADALETLVLATLRSLAENGIDAATLEASLNRVEFRLRESNSGRTPRGLLIMFRALRFWLHDRDPLAALAFSAPLDAIKVRLAAGERYLEDMISRFFLANTHRVTAVLRPDPAQARREAADETARLAAVRAAMSEAELAATVASTQALRRAQQTPDPPEALATIPMLALSDLPRRNRLIPIEITTAHETRILYHELATNEIVYLDVGLDLRMLPADLLPYVEIFGRALTETGAGEQDFVALTQRIGRATGGLYALRWTATVRGSTDATAWLFLRAKSMADKTSDLVDILADVLVAARLDDRERLRQIVLEEKAAMEAALVPSGSLFANMRLRAQLMPADWAAEQTSGISYLMFLRQLCVLIDEDWPRVRAALERIRTLLVNGAAMLCNVTTDAASFRRLEPRLSGFLHALPIAATAPVSWDRGTATRHQGLTVPAPVNYVAKGARLPALGYRPSGATSVARKYLSTSYLWSKVRVEGGAYGASCGIDARSGVLAFYSYRDPNLLATVDVFDRAGDFLTTAAPDSTELTRSIIGTIGEIDDHLLPDAKGFISMQRLLAGDTDEIRQRERDEVLAASRDDFAPLADALERVAETGRVVVIGSEQAIAAANRERQDMLEVTKIL
jgi:Zn-dependent M16 (insulinase) family peptidase